MKNLNYIMLLVTNNSSNIRDDLLEESNVMK